MRTRKKHMPIRGMITKASAPQRQGVWLREVLPPIIVPTIEPNSSNPVERTVSPIFINDVKGNNLAAAINTYFKRNGIDAKIQSPKHAIILNFFFKQYMDIRSESPEIISGSLKKIKNFVFEYDDPCVDATYKLNQSICINLSNPILDLSTNTLLHEIGHAIDLEKGFQNSLIDGSYFCSASVFWRRSLCMLNLPLTKQEREECIPFLTSAEGQEYLSSSISVLQQYDAFSQPAEFITFFWEHLSGPNRHRYKSLISTEMFLKNAITVWQAAALFNTCSCHQSTTDLTRCINNFQIKPETRNDIIHFDKKLRSVLAHHRKSQKGTTSVLHLYRKAKRSLTQDGKELYKKISSIYQKTKDTPEVVEKMKHLSKTAQTLWESYQNNQNTPHLLRHKGRLLPPVSAWEKEK